MSVVGFIFRKAAEVKSSTLLVLPPRIWKIFKTVISWMPGASNFICSVIPQYFLLLKRVFNLSLFQWQHWEIVSENLCINISWGSSISNSSCKYKLHLLELGLYDSYLSFIVQDNGGSSLFTSFQYLLDNFVSLFVWH